MSLVDSLLREDAPTVRRDDSLLRVVRCMAKVGLPALPVVEADDRLYGIFGEREFIGALFPGYLGTLGSAAFVPRSLEVALEKRADCAAERVERYTNTEPVAVGTDYSDTQLAETFLHHRVLLVPVIDRRRVVGVITRRDFAFALARQIGGAP
jgi:CBS domain-containing protein